MIRLLLLASSVVAASAVPAPLARVGRCTTAQNNKITQR